MAEPRLGLTLWSGWEDLPKGASGDNVAYSFRCTYVPYENQLDVWLQLFAGGTVPSLTQADLMDLSEAQGQKWWPADIQRSLAGGCDFGSYGTAILHSAELAWGQVWHVSDGRDCIIARFMMQQAHPLVVADVQHTMLTVHVSARDVE